MNIGQIKEMMELLEKSGCCKMTYKKGDFELHLEKAGASSPKRVVEEVIEAPKQQQKAVEQEGSFVTSPMVGTFYASPSPDQAHFVKVGDKVHESMVVCIIEAMKVMNEVKAGVSGTVAEILLHNGQPVEFGGRLFRVV